MSPPKVIARRTLLAVALATPFACDPSAPEADPIARGSEDAPVVESSDDAREDVAPAGEAEAVDPAANAPARAAAIRLGDVDHGGAEHALARVLMVRAGEDAPPLELRRSDRAAMIYAEPRFGAAFRGKLPHGGSFAVYEKLSADAECRGDGWARVGRGAFACLEHTSATKRKPAELPRLAKGQLTPHFYARISRKTKKGEAPAPGRWKSYASLAAGEDPIDVLVVDHDYAFERRRPSRLGTVLVDSNRRVVRESDVRRLEPSAFAGRDVVVNPLPEDKRLAWSLSWPHTPIRAEPSIDAKVIGKSPMQAELFVTDEIVQKRGVTWIATTEPEGWIDAEEIRRWFPAAPPEDLGKDELWIDVELDQQTLAVMLGDTPLFVTMIASGNHKHPTPRGLYRIKSKMSTSTMDSQAGDDEAYSVEAVPWAQFFHGRYGLHGTFWHNRFGRRTSHGCVNLSAKDAALVYEMTTPDQLPGWAMSFSHAEDLGTVVRVRKLDLPVVDKRKDP